MRISDWSSDVCSSDLHAQRGDLGEHRVVEERVQRALEPEQQAHGSGAHLGGDGQAVGLGCVDASQHLAVAVGVKGALHERERQRPTRLGHRSEEHTSELQSLMRISYAVFCLKKKNTTKRKYSEYNIT